MKKGSKCKSILLLATGIVLFLSREAMSMESKGDLPDGACDSASTHNTVYEDGQEHEYEGESESEPDGDMDFHEFMQHDDEYIAAHVNEKVKRQQGGGETTRLIESVWSGDIKSMMRLLACKANVNQPINGDTTALSFAVNRQREDMVRALIAYDADVNLDVDFSRKSRVRSQNIVYQAVANGQLGIVQALCDAKAMVAGDDNTSHELLSYALRLQDTDRSLVAPMLRILVEAKADVTKNRNSWETPLIFKASQQKNKEVLTILLNAGALQCQHASYEVFCDACKTKQELMHRRLPEEAATASASEEQFRGRLQNALQKQADWAATRYSRAYFTGALTALVAMWIIMTLGRLGSYSKQ